MNVWSTAACGSAFDVNTVASSGSASRQATRRATGRARSAQGVSSISPGTLAEKCFPRCEVEVVYSVIYRSSRHFGVGCSSPTETRPHSFLVLSSFHVLDNH